MYMYYVCVCIYIYVLSEDREAAGLADPGCALGLRAARA